MSRQKTGPRGRGGDIAPLRWRGVPWQAAGAGLVLLALIGALAYHLIPKAMNQSSDDSRNADTVSDIEGVVSVDYAAGQHVAAPQRVAYDRSPPFGGPHDQIWATCTGTVYDSAIRSEHAVHSLEHGAIWIAYDPSRIDGAALASLNQRVDGVPYTFMSPYPGLSKPISIQGWGRQLTLKTADDPRLDQFVAAMRNGSVAPEIGASCSTTPGGFDPRNPPAFDPSPPGPDALPMPQPGPTPRVR